MPSAQNNGEVEASLMRSCSSSSRKQLDGAATVHGAVESELSVDVMLRSELVEISTTTAAGDRPGAEGSGRLHLPLSGPTAIIPCPGKPGSAARESPDEMKVCPST